MEHCEQEFKLGKLQEDGTSLRSHLMVAYRVSGVMPAPIANMTPIPEDMEYLWEWFIELDASRGNNGFGLSCLTYTEILAWATLTDRRPAPWEIEVIQRLDSVRIRVANEK